MKLGLALAFMLLIALLATSQFITFFVVQPIGAIPDGVTLVIQRRERTKFIDSADAFCEREIGQVNLLCRSAALAGVAQGTVYVRLPYVPLLYSFSTGGKHYDR